MEVDSSFRKVVGSLDLNNSKICAHCDTTKTSLWRNGPLGRKSLCNACGIRYQRRGTKALELESKDNKGKKKGRSTEEVSNKRRGMKSLKLGSNSEMGQKKKKNKMSKQVELGLMMTIVGYRKEPVLAQSQHGDEVEKAAIQLMYLSGATQYLIKNK